MKPIDLTEVIALEALASYHYEDFRKRAHGQGTNHVYYLSIVHYIYERAQSCYEIDLFELCRSRVKNRVARSINALVKQDCLEIINRDIRKGYNYRLTNKGVYVLTDYISFLKELEKEYFYKIRENNAISKKIS